MSPASRDPIVFLGPSLSRAAAEAIVRADYRPPVRRGSLDHIARGQVVGIIDGEFDQRLAVSPGEIRDSLRRGVRVLGAASMGALRAAEVPGMIGVGRVYDMYRQGLIEDDDEVAVRFDPETLRPLSEPMVNVRYAVDRLVRSATIGGTDGRAIIRAAKRLPYAARTYPAILKAAGLAEHRDARELMALLASVDLKRDDAVTLLEKLRAVSPPSRSRVGRSAAPRKNTGRSASKKAAADAPVFFWEYGDVLAFRDLLRFMKLTGHFAEHARNAVARHVLAGNQLAARRGGPTPSTRDALLELRKRLGHRWSWITEEEVEVTLADLGLPMVELDARLREEIEAERRVMAVARAESDGFLTAMRAELLIDDLALKREAVRCTSLARLAEEGRHAGAVTAAERHRAAHKLCECVDAVDERRAMEKLGWWGVSKRDVTAFIDSLALARRAPTVGPRRLRRRGMRSQVRLKLAPSPKHDGDRRFCLSLRAAHAHTERLRRVIGVTRVAVITGLGDIGVPNAQAYRPHSQWSSTIGSGKSTTRLGAKVGAVMEEVETWAQEQFPGSEAPPEVTAAFTALARRGWSVLDPAALDLPYDSDYSPDRPIGWRECVDLARGEAVLVPSAALEHRRVANDIFYSARAGRKVFSTSGLAAGFTLEEALTHAICEQIERHAVVLSAIVAGNPGTRTATQPTAIDLSSLPAPTRRLVRRIQSSGREVRILDVTSEIAVPTFAAHIFSDVPPETHGFGFSLREASGRAAHPDPQVAVEMALLEATQTILTNVSGAREDLTLHARSLGRHERTRAQTAVSFVALRAADPPSKALADVPGYVASDCRADVEWLIAQLRAARYDRVLVLDYTRSEIEPARVVRAIVPGLETINPFRTGSRARRALLADLLPQ